MEKKPRYTPDTIQVYPLDMDRLNKSINEFFHKDPKMPLTTTYSARGRLALIRQPKLCIIDDEYAGHDLTDKIIFYIYEEYNENGKHSFACMPNWEVPMPVTDLEQYLKPVITLAEFTKDANFNKSRIQSNQSQWIQYLNK